MPVRPPLAYAPREKQLQHDLLDPERDEEATFEHWPALVTPKAQWPTLRGAPCDQSDDEEDDDSCRSRNGTFKYVATSSEWATKTKPDLV